MLWSNCAQLQVFSVLPPFELRYLSTVMCHYAGDSPQMFAHVRCLRTVVRRGAVLRDWSGAQTRGVKKRLAVCDCFPFASPHSRLHNMHTYIHIYRYIHIHYTYMCIHVHIQIHIQIQYTCACGYTYMFTSTLKSTC